jgi:hypothetical protein
VKGTDADAPLADHDDEKARLMRQQQQGQQQ